MNDQCIEPPPPDNRETGEPLQRLTCFSLSKCVNQLIGDWESNRPGGDQIVSEIPHGLMVSTDKDAVVYILSAALRLLAVGDEKNIIHIAAKMIGNVSLIHIRSTLTQYADQLELSVKPLQLVAGKLGGCLTITQNRIYGLDFAFTFLNH